MCIFIFKNTRWTHLDNQILNNIGEFHLLCSRIMSEIMVVYGVKTYFLVFSIWYIIYNNKKATKLSQLYLLNVMPGPNITVYHLIEQLF